MLNISLYSSNSLLFVSFMTLPKPSSVFKDISATVFSLSRPLPTSLMNNSFASMLYTWYKLLSPLFEYDFMYASSTTNELLAKYIPAYTMFSPKLNVLFDTDISPLSSISLFKYIAAFIVSSTPLFIIVLPSIFNNPLTTLFSTSPSTFNT